MNENQFMWMIMILFWLITAAPVFLPSG